MSTHKTRTIAAAALGRKKGSDPTFIRTLSAASLRMSVNGTTLRDIAVASHTPCVRAKRSNAIPARQVLAKFCSFADSAGYCIWSVETVLFTMCMCLSAIYVPLVAESDVCVHVCACACASVCMFVGGNSDFSTE